MDSTQINAIARVLFYPVDLSQEEVARVLMHGVQDKKTGHTGPIWTLEEQAQRLHECGIGESAEAAMIILRDGLNLPHKDIAAALYDPEGADLTAQTVARALYAPEGLGLDAVHVASAMKNALIPITDLTDALKNGLNLSVNEVVHSMLEAGFEPAIVAWAAHHERGLGLPIHALTHVMLQNLGSASLVAKVLHDPQGLNLPLDEIAKVFHDPNGLKWPVSSIAKMMSEAGFSQELTSNPEHEARQSAGTQDRKTDEKSIQEFSDMALSMPSTDSMAQDCNGGISTKPKQDCFDERPSSHAAQQDCFDERPSSHAARSGEGNSLSIR